MTALISHGLRGARAASTELAVPCALLAYGIVEVTVINGDRPYLPGRLLTAAAIVLPLAFARRFAVGALVLTIAGIVGGTLAGLIPTPAILPLPCYVIGFYAVGAHEPRLRVACAAAVACVVVVWLGLLVQNDSGLDAFIGMAFMATLPFVLGVVVQRRTSEARELARVTAQLEAEQTLREQRAVEAERARIARELHDIVAHSLSLIAVQAGAASRTAEIDRDALNTWLQTIGTTARDSLGEMRRMLTVLRGEDEPAARAPQPGLAQLEDLVEQLQRAGGAVALRTTGAPRPLAPGVDLAAYRIVQEALTNARKHGASGTITVSVDYRTGELRLEVSSPLRAGSPRQPNGTGHGLIGMRERARLYGGDLSAAATPEGRFVVAARLPTEDTQ